MINQWRDTGTWRDKKEKATQGEKIIKQLEESTGERSKIKEIPTKGKAIKQKQDIQKQRKKSLPTSGRRWCKNIPTTGWKRKRTISD